MADWRTLAQRLWFLPLAATILWWTVRLCTLGRVSFETGIAVGALVNFALLILVVFLQDRLSIPDADFIGRLKSNMKPAVIYACLAAVSVAGLHHVVAAEATALRKLERERFIEQSLSDKAGFVELQANDIQLANMDRETVRTKAMASLRFQFNPLWHMTASLLALLAAALSTTLFVTFIGQVLRA